MRNPKHFNDPNIFKPDRFLDEEGKFMKNSRVCPFGFGLRNCIGEKFARTQYFVFSAEVIRKNSKLNENNRFRINFSVILFFFNFEFFIRNFTLVKIEGSLNADVIQSAILQIKPMKLTFIQRNK
jgi:hypothetical protein